MTTSMQHENAIQLTTTDPLQFKERTHTVADDTENSVCFYFPNDVINWLIAVVHSISNPQQASSSSSVIERNRLQQAPRKDKFVRGCKPKGVFCYDS